VGPSSTTSDGPFFLAARHRQLFVSPQVGTVISRRREGDAASMIGCDARHTSKILWERVCTYALSAHPGRPPPKPSGVFFVAHRSKNEKTDGGQFPERSRVGAFTLQHEQKNEVRYWTEALGCNEDELAAAVAKVGNSARAVRREVFRTWAYGRFQQGASKTKAPSPRRRPSGRPRKRAEIRWPIPPPARRA
jgi:hypothetical protein